MSQELNYVPLHEFADDYCVDYNALCTAVRAALTAPAKEQAGPNRTGSPAGMLQDDSRQLSRALASKPDAKLHAREAAAAVNEQAEPIGWVDNKCGENKKFATQPAPLGLNGDDAVEEGMRLALAYAVACAEFEKASVAESCERELLAEMKAAEKGLRAHLSRMAGTDAGAVDASEIAAALYLDADAPTAKQIIAAINRQQSEIKALTHKVICCGVAARHPDAALTTHGAYKEKWDSPQAEEVRKLRADRDRLLAAGTAPARMDKVGAAPQCARCWGKARVGLVCDECRESWSGDARRLGEQVNQLKQISTNAILARAQQADGGTAKEKP